MQKKNEITNIQHKKMRKHVVKHSLSVIILSKETWQTIFVSIMLLQMKNEQRGIARVLSGFPLVVVGGEYAAN